MLYWQVCPGFLCGVGLNNHGKLDPWATDISYCCLLDISPYIFTVIWLSMHSHV